MRGTYLRASAAAALALATFCAHTFIAAVDSGVSDPPDPLDLQGCFATGLPIDTLDVPTVRFAYLIPSNRTPQPYAVPALRQTIVLMHHWMAEQMERNGFGFRSFRYELMPDGTTPRVHVVPVEETDLELRTSPWMNTTNAAQNAGIDLWEHGEIWVLIPEMHIQHPDGTIEGRVALGSGLGSHGSGGVALVDSVLLSYGNVASLTDDRLYDGMTLPEIGPYELVARDSFASFEGVTISAIVSSHIGRMLHEMGHAFGLGHDSRNDVNFRGNLMYNGYRGFRGSVFPDRYIHDFSRLSYASALMLATSHYFEAVPPIDSVGDGTEFSGLPSPPPPSVDDDTPSTELLGGDDMVPPPGDLDSTNSEAATDLQVMTSGESEAVGGLLEVHFIATAPEGLQCAVLKTEGMILAEVPLTGSSANVVLRTPDFTANTPRAYSVLVYDQEGTRTTSVVSITPVAVFNRAPMPFFKVTPPRANPGETVLLDAHGSSDPDGISVIMMREWDTDGDGEFDTPPTQDLTFPMVYTTGGNRLVRVRLTDTEGAATVSTPIAVRIHEVGSICAADLTHDGWIDEADLVTVVLDWGCATPEPCLGDANEDGIVDVRDLLAVIMQWGACTGDV